MANSEFKRTGGQARLTVDGVLIPVTSWSVSWNKNMQEATDSADWHPTRLQLGRSQMPGVLEIEIEVEFNFYSNLTQASLLDKLRSSNEPVDVVLYLDDDASTVIEEGVYWPGEAEIEAEVGDNAPVTGSLTFTNEGLPA